jgi:superfamily II DNA/RNA helicase
MTFAQLNLHADILKALLACGYTIPTPIQRLAIPIILKGKDIVASAPTGTGKTAAFVLPALHRLSLSKGTPKPRILILTPTRELASQITTAASKYGKFMRFNIISLLGGMPYRQQLRDLSRPVDIIVATPGRLLDHMANKRLDLSAIEMLVLDEADRMLDMGFIDDVREIAKCATLATRQTLLFSATVDDKLSGVVAQLLKEPVRVNLSEETLAPKLIKQTAYIADNNQHKERLLQHLISNENMYKAIIFSGTKINADYLARRLRDLDLPATALHGDLKQNMRNKTVEQFRRGRIQFLVATDVAARGIDINDVTHVINYDLPKFSEDYVHRIGRTGRAGKTGIAISLVLPVDARHLQKIEKFIGEKITFETIAGLEPTKRLNNAAANAAGKKKRFGGGSSAGRSFGGGYQGKSSESRGYEVRAAKKGEGRGRFENNSEARREYKPRFENSHEPRRDYKNRSENGGEARREFKPRFENSNEPRRDFKNRSENGGEARREFKPRFETSNEPRRDFKNRSENGGEARREFKPRFENSNEPRRDFKNRSGNSGEAKREFKPRFENSSEPRREFKDRPANSFEPRKEGRESYARSSEARPAGRRGEGRSPFVKRSEFSESGPAGRSEGRRGEGRNENRNAGFKERAPRHSETRSEKSKDPRVSYAKSSNPARRTNDKRGNFSRDAAPMGKIAGKRGKPFKYSV